MRKAIASLATLLICFGSTQATAQDRTIVGGFSLNRFDPSERGSDWFSQESLDIRGGARPAIGAIFDYAYKPLVIYDENDDEAAVIVKHQMFAHVGGSFVLWERLRLGLSLPLVIANDGNTGVLVADDGTTTFVDGEEGGGVGDLRAGLDLRVAGQYGGPAVFALGAQVHFPTGNKAAFTSDDQVRIMPRLMLAGDIGIFAYALKGNLHFRGQDDFNDKPFGTELGFGAAAGLRVADKKLVIGPELFGTTVISDSGDGAFKRTETPFELIFGGHYRAGDWKLGLGAGPGLTRGVGAPALRALASIEYFPEVKEKEAPPPPADRDGDGIVDDEDACPDQAGVASDDPAKHGCPAPGDRDGDGILDEQDACPDEAGEANDDPAKNGCPPPKDSDSDGIPDEKDACPNEAGEPNDDPAKNGCPPPKDSDGDGIMDPDDACPDKAGPASEDPKKNGCPRAKIVGKKIEILDRVEFDTAKATIRSSSETVLNAVLDIMKKNPQIKLVSVEGHTDNKGARYYNVGLSRRRAASVVKWLVDKGIEKKRLASKGFGPDKPRDTNDTDEGRQNNRRVEFHIKKMDEKK